MPEGLVDYLVCERFVRCTESDGEGEAFASFLQAGASVNVKAGDVLQGKFLAGSLYGGATHLVEHCGG